MGAPCFRAGFCSKTIIPDSEEHPLASSRAVPKAVLRWIRANAYSPTGYVRYAVEEVRSGAVQAGRDPRSVTIACMLVVRPTEAPEAIWPGLKRRIVRLLAEPYIGEVLLERDGFDPSILGQLRESTASGSGEDAVGLVTDDMVEAFYVVGPAARCKARIAEYREAGVDVPLLLPRLDDYRVVAESLAQ